MPRWDEFFGGSYQGWARQADAERAGNWMVERAASAGAAAKSPLTFVPRPGFKPFATLRAATQTPPTFGIVPQLYAGYEFSGSNAYGDFTFEYQSKQYAFLCAEGYGPQSPNGDGKLHAMVSSDNGATWSELDAAHAPKPSGNQGTTITIARDGATVYTLSLTHSGEGGTSVEQMLVLVPFDLTSGVWGATKWFYTRQVPNVWLASTPYQIKQTLIDSNGHTQLCIARGTSSPSAPAWSTSGGAVSDGPTLQWLDQGIGNQPRWAPSFAFGTSECVIAAGHLHEVTTSGTSGASAPSWNTAGGTTTDGSVTWQDRGVAAAAPAIDFVQNAWAFFQLIRRGSGDLVLYYSGPRLNRYLASAGTGVSRAYCATFDGTNWGTTDQELPGQTDATASYVPRSGCLDSAGLVHLLYGSGGSDYHVALSGANTFGSVSTLTTADAAVSNGGCVSQIITYPTGAGERLAAIGNRYDDPSNPSTTTVSLVMWHASAVLNPTWSESVIASGPSLGAQQIYPDGGYLQALSATLGVTGNFLVAVWDSSADFSGNQQSAQWTSADIATLTWAPFTTLEASPNYNGSWALAQMRSYTNTLGLGLALVWYGQSGGPGGVGNIDNQLAQYALIIPQNLPSVPAATDAIPALAALNNRVFAIAREGPANLFFELHRDGTATKYGALAGDRRPQMKVSQTQVMVLSGGLGYIFDLRANTFTPITDPDFPTGATKVDFLDGYFVVLEPNSQAFALSGLNDGLSWDALDFGDAEGQPGNTVSMVVDHRQIWFLGTNHGEIYYDLGASDFPIKRLEGAFMETGSAAIDGAFACDNTIFWLGTNDAGGVEAYRANGYQPLRISTHPIEKLIASFGDISDASGYPYKENGHLIARWDFPSARGGDGASLCYDVSSGFWHERFFWNARRGVEMGDLGRCHCYAWGKHLAGSWRSGEIYEQSMDYATDAGALIKRLRASPDLANGGRWTRYPELRILADVGVGLDGRGFVPYATPIPDGGAPAAGAGVDPQLILELSDDGGETWSVGSTQSKSMGRMGQTQTLIRYQRLGRSNNRAVRVTCSEPVPAALLECDFDAI
jgi:hypothetical protein